MVQNDGCLTRLTARPDDMDGIIDLVLTSRAEAPVTKFDVLAKQNSDLLSCVLLINNRHANKNKANKKKSTQLLYKRQNPLQILI